MHKVGRLRVYLILLLALLVQVTVLGHFRIFGARPDLMAICVIFSGLFLGRPAGLETGLAAGLLTDLFSLDHFGINMFIYGVTGLLAGALRTSIAKETKRTQFLAVFLCTAFAMCLHFSLVSAFSRSAILSLPEYLKACVLPAGVYTAILSVPIFMKFLEMYDLREEDDLL